MAYAACRGRHDLAWHLDHPRSRKERQRIAEAITICETCPVRTACLMHAIKYGEIDSIWGGLTPLQRAQLAQRCIACGEPISRFAHANRRLCHACDSQPCNTPEQ